MYLVVLQREKNEETEFAFCCIHLLTNRCWHVAVLLEQRLPGVKVLLCSVVIGHCVGLCRKDSKFHVSTPPSESRLSYPLNYRV